MKSGLDEVSLGELRPRRRGGARAVGSHARGRLVPLRDPHEAVDARARSSPRSASTLLRAAYLDDTGHMSGVDPLLALDRAVRAGEIADGDLVLLLAAGTGYTWAASVVRWGHA